MPLKRKIRLFLSGMAATKRLVLIFLTTTGLASVANAQGLPTAEKPSCFTDFWTYNNSSIKDCPLSYAGITLYGNIDGGYGWENHGVPLSASASKVNYAIQRNSNRSTWLWSPNAASTSTVGVKIEETISGKWLFIGVAETGFNPYSMRLINGPQSLVDNNLNTLQFQTSHFDLSRAGQWDNGQGFVGISNPEYGTLTFGRTTTLSSTAISKYDPVASTAFSQIGFSATYATFGASPTAHSNTAVTYRLDYPGLRLAWQAQIGGYDLGNASTGMYQFQVGGDYGNLSFDAIYGYSINSVSLATFGGGALPAGFDPDSILKATVHNNQGVELLAQYKWDKFKFYAGYVFGQTTNPSNTNYPNGIQTIAAEIFVPPGSVTINTYNLARDQNTVWTGVRYAALKNLDLSAGVYWETQNDYLQGPAVCTGSGINTSSSKCSGGRYSYSFMIDYKPVPRIDIYAGVMVANVYGGVASGYLYTQSVDPTIGIRYRF